MKTISYSITCYNEIVEMSRLLKIICDYKWDVDEIVILIDDTNEVPEELLYVIDEYSKDLDNNISVYSHKLNKNFGEHKNYLNQQCKNQYIFNVDADEQISEILINNIHEILDANSDVDLFRVPRVNTVENITQEHINKWGWKVNSDGWLNWPDYQNRIFRNTPEIHWVYPVHEIITGHKTIVNLPEEEAYCLYHHKTIKKQVQQNKFYSKIN